MAFFRSSIVRTGSFMQSTLSLSSEARPLPRAGEQVTAWLTPLLVKVLPGDWRPPAALGWPHCLLLLVRIASHRVSTECFLVRAPNEVLTLRQQHK